MGLGIVLLFWVVAGTVISVTGSLIFGGAVTLFTRGVSRGRRWAVMSAFAFPFLCAGWFAAIFLFQAIVNETLLNRDLVLGDTWHARLPNGYQVMMIDVTDQGWIYNPKTQGVSGVVGDQEDAVPGVRIVQVAGSYILGGVDSQHFEHLGKDTGQVDSYFLLDTQTGKKAVLASYDALRDAALRVGIQPHLEPIDTVYSRYRWTWFDTLVAILFFIPPLIGFLLLIWWVIRLRQRHALISQSV
jgi:hypothetical protein